MSKKCKAYSESKLGLGPADNRKAFYAGWDAALREALAEQAIPEAEIYKREWVGLTNEERNKLWRDVIGWGDPSHDDEDLMKAIEAKLKEKNQCK